MLINVGRKYRLNMLAVSVTAAKDLMRISSASTKCLAVIGVLCTQETLEVSEQLPLLLQRCSTDGTGTSGTAEKAEDGDPAFAGTFVTNLTADTTLSGGAFHREGQNVLNGWDWDFQTSPFVLAPSARGVVRLPTAPAAAMTLTLCVTVVEIG